MHPAMIHIQVAAVVSVNDGRLVKIQRALHFMRVIQDRERFKPSVWKIQYAEILRPKQSSRSMRVYEPRGTSCCRGDVAGDGSSASEGFIVRVGNNDKD